MYVATTGIDRYRSEHATASWLTSPAVRIAEDGYQNKQTASEDPAANSQPPRPSHHLESRCKVSVRKAALSIPKHNDFTRGEYP